MPKGKQNSIYTNMYNRRQKLLDMLYTPSELAETLGINRGYVYTFIIPSGRVEVIKDETDHLFINGRDMYKFIMSMSADRRERKANRVPLSENEFYCLKCKARKTTNDYLVSMDRGGLVKTAHCPDCGTRMRKYISEGEKE